MKHISLIVFIILLYSCRDNRKPTTGKLSNVAIQSANKTPKEKDNYFVLLKGKINDYPITMYLFALNHIYSGYYYYESKQLPIYFEGEDSSMKSKIVLMADVNNDTSETFTFSFDGNSATGSWSLGSKKLALSLTKEDLPVSFNYVGWKDSSRLSEKLPATTQATAELASIWPTGSSATDQFIKKQITKLLANKDENDSITVILAKDGKGFFDEYHKEFSNEDLSDTNLADTEVNNNPEEYNYSIITHLRISYQSPKLLSLAMLDYSYIGGAHGNYGTTYLPLDLLHNKALTLKNILTTTGIRQLRPLLESSFRRDKHLTSTESLKSGGLFENKIEPNDDFYVTGKGLIFNYTPYEIASFADGEIQIMIDYKDLKAYLQPAFVNLLQ